MLQPPTAEKLSWKETVASQLRCHRSDRSVSQLLHVKEASYLATDACQGKQLRETLLYVFILHIPCGIFTEDATSVNSDLMALL